MTHYRIEVKRAGGSNGTLTFFEGTRKVFSTPCWEDPERRVGARTYTGCSTTLMSSKGYPSVYLPDEQTRRRGIFVHKGTSPEWSDGCIVCAPRRMQEIYDTVPRNGRNVTVTVS